MEYYHPSEEWHLTINEEGGLLDGVLLVCQLLKHKQLPV